MKIKIDVISGFLGAGKTTLIKKLISEKLSEDKIAIIENEFGETGIDGSIVKNSSIEVKEINSGCICCNMSGEFISGIKEVVKQFHPERIIIEPTGVGKLSDVIKACQDKEISDTVETNMVIVVVDMNRFNAYITNFSEFYENQIKYAKTILLSRTKNADTFKIEKVVNAIRQINEQANIVTTDWDKISGGQIVELAENSSNYSLESQIKRIVKIARPHGIKPNTMNEGHVHNHAADEVFEVWEVETPRKYDREALEKTLSELSNWDKYGMILRSKGILEQPDGEWLHFDYVPGELNIEAYSADYSGRICVIGSKLVKGELQRLFNL